MQKHLACEGNVADAVGHALGAADHLVGKKQWKHTLNWITHLFDPDE